MISISPYDKRSISHVTKNMSFMSIILVPTSNANTRREKKKKIMFHLLFHINAFGIHFCPSLGIHEG